MGTSGGRTSITISPLNSPLDECSPPEECFSLSVSLELS